MQTQRVLFITGPPGSGRTTLAEGIRFARPSTTKVISVGTVVAEILPASDARRQLHTCYLDEHALARAMTERIMGAGASDVVVDGAPLEPGQIWWASSAYAKVATVVLEGVGPTTPNRMPAYIRWYAIQIHQLAGDLEAGPFLLARRPIATNVLEWWDRVVPLTGSA